VIFREGKIVKKVPEKTLLDEFFKEVEAFLQAHPERIINPQQ
jgi:(E)-4-hydroxy-3-methylbut-2-enyl-diphosphate synthase